MIGQPAIKALISDTTFRIFFIYRIWNGYDFYTDFFKGPKFNGVVFFLFSFKPRFGVHYPNQFFMLHIFIKILNKNPLVTKVTGTNTIFHSGSPVFNNFKLM